jgi:hypothetical protein
MPLATTNGPCYSDAPETEERNFATAMGTPLIGDEKQCKKTLQG